MKRTMLDTFVSPYYMLWVFPEIVHVHKRYANSFASVLGVEKATYARSPGEDREQLQSLLRRIIQETKSRKGDKWHIGLSLEHFTLVNFTLPQAAQDNLTQAVRYALMRHVPFEISQAFFNFQHDVTGEQLDVAAIVSPHDMIEPLLSPFAEAGLNVDTVFPTTAAFAFASDDGVYVNLGRTEQEFILKQNSRVSAHLYSRQQDESGRENFLNHVVSLTSNLASQAKSLFVISTQPGHVHDMPSEYGENFEDVQIVEPDPELSLKHLSLLPYKINLLPQTIKRQERLAGAVQAAALVFFLLSLLALPGFKILGMMHYAEKIERKVESSQARVEEVKALRAQNQKDLDFLKSLAAEMKGQSDAGDVLKELTEVVPETSWLYSFEFSGGTISIQGRADSATGVLEALENSPLFSEVHFDTSVKKSGSQDRFKIVAQVKQ